MTHECFPQPGDKMQFTGENGYPIQLTEALKIFKVGDVVTVKDVRIGGWETRLTFWGRDGSHNSVMFISLPAGA